MFKLGITFSLFFLSLLAVGQELSLLKLKQASIQPFVMGGAIESQFSLSDALLFTNNDELLQMSDMKDSYYFYGFNSNIGMNISTGFQIRAKDNNYYHKAPLIRIGLQGSSLNMFNFYGDKKEVTTFDTLTSNPTNQVWYSDSVDATYYNVNKRAQLVSLDASLIFQTDTEKKWSLYGGAGFTAGLSINSYTEISGSNSRYMQLRSMNNETSRMGYGSASSGIHSRHANQTNVMGTFYIPIGINVNLGCNSDFWRRIHLFYEFRSGVSFVSVPESANYTGFTFLHGIGLSVVL